MSLKWLFERRAIDAPVLDGAALRAYVQDPRLYGVDRWRNFIARCFTPSVFYDIGANDPFSIEGQQVVLKPVMPDTRFYLFEALAKHEQALAASGEPYAVAVLGDENGREVTFYETSRFAAGTGDSYYLERTAFYDDASRIATTHRTRRLDDLVAERGWPLPDFMKLDTQGSELDILRGAPRCLAAARGLQVECAVRRYNEGAPLLPEVLAFAQAQGFRVYDFVQMHFNPASEVSQVDILFVRADVIAHGD